MWQLSSTPWGYPALGRRSRKKNKYSDDYEQVHKYTPEK